MLHTRARLALLSRGLRTMATNSSPFTQAVVAAVRNVYPEKLADSSFDNTGLLLEAPHRQNGLKNSVLLTIDLTTAVADEAIRRKDSVIIAYHPIIFRGLKALTLANSQQRSLLRLAQEGISVYCPHTAVDGHPEGLGQWLGEVIRGKAEVSSSEAINPVKPPDGMESAGSGRIVKFASPQKLGSLIENVRTGLGGLNGLSVAVPQSVPAGKKSDVKISSVGICAGSGGSMLNGLDVDLLFTGELSHHEALAVVEQGKCVITTFHSNTERAFLKDRMRDVMHKAIRREMGKVDELSGKDVELEIGISEVDRDPYEIVTAGQENW